MIHSCKKEENCCETWVATYKTLKQEIVGDWEKLYLNDSLWFEFKITDSLSMPNTCEIIEYNKCGEKFRSGMASFYEHPIEDYEVIGEWTLHSCTE